MALVSNMSFVLHVWGCPTFSVSTPFHLVSVQITVWYLLPPDGTSRSIPSLGFSPYVPRWVWYSALRPILLRQTAQAFPRSCSHKPLAHEQGFQALLMCPEMLPNIWFQQAGMEHAGSHHVLLEVCGFLLSLHVCETPDGWNKPCSQQCFP